MLGLLDQLGAPEVGRFHEPEIDADRQIDGHAPERARALADAPQLDVSAWMWPLVEAVLRYALRRARYVEAGRSFYYY